MKSKLAGAGHVLDDILRHGNHDVFWCYEFEQEVRTYKGIKTNNKDFEATFTAFYTRTSFIHIFLQLQKDKDGLFPAQRALLAFHKYLYMSSDFQEMGPYGKFGCPMWHSNGYISTTSEAAGLALWKEHFHNLPCDCSCRRLLISKGVVVAPKIQKLQNLSRASIRYFQ